jgi:hypothetical protein
MKISRPALQWEYAQLTVLHGFIGGSTCKIEVGVEDSTGASGCQAVLGRVRYIYKLLLFLTPV